MEYLENYVDPKTLDGWYQSIAIIFFFQVMTVPAFLSFFLDAKKQGSYERIPSDPERSQGRFDSD